VSVVEVVPQEQTDEIGPDSSVGNTAEIASVPVVPEQSQVSRGSRTGDVMDSRDEGGTCGEFLDPQDGRDVPEHGVPSLLDSTDTDRMAPQAPEVSTNTSQVG
jgi:hypothetical protein